ncbi:hypothetical protein HMPREF9163_02372 [Selenomonas sp. oral taxon 138 str. F0429]|nr:hypothetical protein HMPREF9163_02372 [Selenomonas sp. oral taxon 138 str. F0429]
MRGFFMPKSASSRKILLFGQKSRIMNVILFKEALINSARSSWSIFFALSASTNPPHSFCYASGLSP